MDLLAVTVAGFKRFKDSSSIQTNGKLVAILGPNEAGKSTLLEAIAHLGNNNPLDIREVTRGSDSQDFSITAKFYLDENDLEVSGLGGPRSMIFTKKYDGTRTYRFEPPPPDRDISHREPFLSALLETPADPELHQALTEAADQISTPLDDILAPLRSENHTLEAEEIATLQSLLSILSTILEREPNKRLAHLLDKFTSLIALEQALTPSKFAAQTLIPRVPKFLFFDDAARDLRTSYSIAALRGAVPTALGNLLEVAELSLSDVFSAIDRNDTSEITTLERRASRTLGQKFKIAWRQSGVEAALRIQGDNLEIQIVNKNDQFTSIAERSDGMRQFIALQAFSTRNHADNPILLIDEAEQRLHYDAQADLVQMLAKQQVSSKVIYTTHSAGCLPEDLGNGVRLVMPTPEESSRVVNRFWAEEGEGLSPLLIGMGASTMAFFPTRRAVMVEGAADMLLYPTLFREVLKKKSLGFQFVPGLSNIQRTMTPQALSQEVGIVYLVDGDAGGDRIAARLRRRGGVEPNDILVARSPDGAAVELEDFVAAEHLVAAANQHLAKWLPEAPPIDLAALGPVRRMAALEQAFRTSAGIDLPKISLAYELLDLASTDQTIQLVDPNLRPILEDIGRSIIARLGVDS